MCFRSLVYWFFTVAAFGTDRAVFCVFVLGANAAVSLSARARARVEMTASLCTRVSFFYRWGAFVVSEDVPRVFQSVISCVSVASKAYRIGLVSLLR